VAESSAIDYRIGGLLGEDIFITGDIMGVEYGEFKGHKMIILKKDDSDQYPFQFGKAKAKLIVEHFNDIKKFAEEE